jgi:two-component system sensor histidine kinase BaeS
MREGGPPWHRSGFRPPWWPDDEPFPPEGHRPWGFRRRRFIRRVAFGLLVFVAFLAGTIALATALVSRALGVRGGPLFGASLVGLAVLAVGLVVVVRLIRGAAGPLGDVMDAADRLAAGDYTVRVEPRGPGEVRRLGEAFNQMADRLGSAEERRRSLFADVAHELRTPLSVIRGSAEGMLDGLYQADGDHLQTVLDQTVVMARLLDDLQTLSTAEAGALRLYREPTEPAALVTEAVSRFRGQADERGVGLRGDAAPGLPVIDVDPVRIDEVLSNLVGNALRHTPRAGEVVVRVEATAGGVTFIVTDTGPGISAADLPHVFDRFWKSADSGGSGLGLAIAKHLVEAHGGTIAAESGPTGGTTLRVWLPRGG